jgi:hypothetical protein
VAVFAATFLSGCGSSPFPSKNDIDKAVRGYVGLARPDIGDVKLDDLKILSESIQKMGDEDVFFRKFEAHYTVTYQNTPSKHTFEGTIALIKQGGEWVLKKEASQLSFTYSPPTAETVKESPTNQSEETKRSQAKP